MSLRLSNKTPLKKKASLLNNSIWGVVSSIVQLLFVSVFFIILARKYQPDVFGRFLVANTVYQIVAAFSSMGLSQWFIRQYVLENDKVLFAGKFLKFQTTLGIAFVMANIVIALLLYQDVQIRLLCVVLGTNIIFDNFINAVKALNIAENEQRKTAVVLMVDGFLKLLVSCVLFLYALPLIWLSVLMVLLRIVTVFIVLQLGLLENIGFKHLWRAPMVLKDLKQLIVANWQFVVIGSISIIYWRSGNLIISKMLTLAHVADYELAFRFFSILQIIPLVASSTVYPQFIKHFNNNDISGLKRLYKNIFVFYTLFAVLVYVFVYAFSDMIIPLAFGNNYPGAIQCMRHMFLTILLLPTVLLQANLIVAIGLEKLDMWFNVISLSVHVIVSVVGLTFIKELYVVNYAVFLSFIVFHLLQDVFLLRRKLISVKHCIIYYMVIVFTVICCRYGTTYINVYWLFALFVMIAAFLGLLFIAEQRKLQRNRSLTGI